MPVLSSTVVYGTLILAGMPKARCTEFVSIARCESGLRTDAISPAGALGLWQIMPFNFAPLGLSQADWQNPDTNARAAVLLSNGGANCAAWDTCYRDITASGRYRFLNWPEPGSCAWQNLGVISIGVGTANSGGAVAPSAPGIDGSLEQTVSQYQTAATRTLPAAARQLHAAQAVAARLYTR